MLLPAVVKLVIGAVTGVCELEFSSLAGFRRRREKNGGVLWWFSGGFEEAVWWLFISGKSALAALFWGEFGIPFLNSKFESLFEGIRLRSWNLY